MLGVISAFLAALCWALSGLLAKKGLMNLSPHHSVFLTLIAGLPIVSLFAYVNGDFVSHHSLNIIVVAYLALIGIIRYLGGRWFKYLTIQKVGIARATSVTSTSGFFAFIFGITLLGEKATLNLAIGVVLVFLGVYFISTSRANHKSKLAKSQFLKGMIYGLAGGFSWGFAHPLTRISVSIIGSPIIGCLVSNSLTLVCFIPIFCIIGFGDIWEKGRSSAGWIILAGVFNSMGALFDFIALGSVPVVIAAPIVNIEPLFVLILSYIFMRGTEMINFKVVLGTIFTLAGVCAILIG